MEFILKEISGIFNKIKSKFLEMFKDYKKAIIILSLVFVIGFYPIIMANFNYIIIFKVF